MRNIKVILAYDGSEFAGWQVQPNLPSIQGTLATAIGRVTGEKVLPQGSGRTDAGVHALGQVANFTLASVIPVCNICTAVNDVLPPSIRLLEASEVSPEFHARKSASSKVYRFRIYREAICPPFLARYVWHYPYPLDGEAMQKSARHVIGEHDFTSFAADHEKRLTDHEAAGRELQPTNVRRIFDSNWELRETEWIYTVRGSGFLHHMVRNLVGTFLLVGKGSAQVDDISKVLRARSRAAAGSTVPPQGLYLVKVEY